MRRGESLLLTLGLPVLFLVFFSLVDVLPTNEDDPVDFLAPGILALAVMSTAMVNVAIATGFERQYGVLKRLGSTPLGRPRLLAAKTEAVLVIELLQIAVLALAALALGWEPDPAAGFLLALVLGTAAFAGLGLLLAGRLRGETTLLAANGLWAIFLLLGGMVIPLDELPAALEVVAKAFPAAALAAAFDGTLTAGASTPAWAWAVLALWAVAAPVAAAATFRWE
jgi:ABC-2 type transport system permease protein